MRLVVALVFGLISAALVMLPFVSIVGLANINLVLAGWWLLTTAVVLWHNRGMRDVVARIVRFTALDVAFILANIWIRGMLPGIIDEAANEPNSPRVIVVLAVAVAVVLTIGVPAIIVIGLYRLSNRISAAPGR